MLKVKVDKFNFSELPSFCVCASAHVDGFLIS